MKNITINIHPLAALLAVVAALAVSCQEPGEPAEELWEYEIGLENSGRLSKAWTFMTEHTWTIMTERIPAYGGPRPQVSDLPALMVPSPMPEVVPPVRSSAEPRTLLYGTGVWSGMDEVLRDQQDVTKLVGILARRTEEGWEYAGLILCPAAESGSAYYVLWKRKRLD